MRNLVGLYLVFAVVVAACGSDDGTTDDETPSNETAPPTTPSDGQAVAEGCVTFDDLALGNMFALGDVFSSDGVDIEVGEFFTGGSSFAIESEVQDGGMAGGTGNEMWINNVTLNFELPASPNGWSIDFGDYGGEENLGVNGDNVGNDAGAFEDWNGSTFGGADVMASGGLNTNDGELLIIGAGVSQLTIGGQELAIDNVCPIAEPGDGTDGQAVAEGCVTFDDLALGNMFALGDVFSSDGVDIEVGEFFTGGSSFAIESEVQDGGMAGGTGNEMWINNVTLNFELPASPNGWSIDFGDYGGEENLGVNGDNVGNDAGAFEDWNGSTFGGADVMASGGLNTNDGELLIIGAGVSQLTIGGQELAIDNVCPIP